MDIKQISVVLKLRKSAVDAARGELARCLAVAEAARAALSAAQAALHHERAYATEPSRDDVAVEAFAAWLPIGQKTIADAGEVLERAEAAVVDARAKVSAARVAEHAIEKVIEKAEAERKAAALRAERLEAEERLLRPPS